MRLRRREYILALTAKPLNDGARDGLISEESHALRPRQNSLVNTLIHRHDASRVLERGLDVFGLEVGVVVE